VTEAVVVSAIIGVSLPLTVAMIKFVPRKTNEKNNGNVGVKDSLCKERMNSLSDNISATLDPMKADIVETKGDIKKILSHMKITN